MSFCQYTIFFLLVTFVHFHSLEIVLVVILKTLMFRFKENYSAIKFSDISAGKSDNTAKSCYSLDVAAMLIQKCLSNLGIRDVNCKKGAGLKESAAICESYMKIE